MDSEGKLVVNLTRGCVVCDDVVIADRARRRMRGLLGRDSLSPGDGMLLQPAPSIHTAFMRFPIDAVFIDGTLRVKKTVPNLRPWRIASARRAWGVLELAEGEITRRGIGLGDQLGVVQVSDELGAVDSKSGWPCWNWSTISTTDTDALPTTHSAETNGGMSNDGSAALAERARDGLSSAGARVLVVGSDRRFRSVAAALLTRRGCAVTLSDRTTNVGALARTERAEVVVLDAGLSLTDAARAAAQIESLETPVGLVVVGEDPTQSLATMPVLPKWGSFDQLYEAIENASSVRVRTV